VLAEVPHRLREQPRVERLGRIVLAPANVWEPAVMPRLAEHMFGLRVGERNDDAPRLA
jgi:hypothetical protein